ncbi:hypothetical protein D3C73_1093110 [compost metagenome]
MVIARTVFAPLHFLATASQAQRHRQAPGMLVQDAQVELHQVPANNGVGIVPGKPGVELFQQQGSGVAILQGKVHLGGVTVWRSEHVHLALTATLQGDRIQLALFGGFDIQRDQLQARPIIRGRLELGIEQQAAGVRRSSE